MSKVATFVRNKTLTITALVQAVIGLLLGFEVVHWSPVQCGQVMTVVSAFLALFVAGTVTANARLNGGKMWGGFDGKTEADDPTPEDPTPDDPAADLPDDPT